MSIRYRPPTDPSQHAAAVCVFAAEGGRLPSAANQPFSPTGAERALMYALGIQFDGRAFRFGGYRYSRLADAMNDARRALPGAEVLHWTPT